MEARLNPETTATKHLPDVWTKELAEILTESYPQKGKREFTVMAPLYSNELMLIVGLALPLTGLEKLDEGEKCVCLALSCELSKSDVGEELLKALTDATGHFYDQFFLWENQSDFADDEEENTLFDNVFSPVWSEIEFKGHTFSYKSSRENLALSSLADSLLNS
jgi:hypothetical protein